MSKTDVIKLGYRS